LPLSFRQPSTLILSTGGTQTITTAEICCKQLHWQNQAYHKKLPFSNFVAESKDWLKLLITTSTRSYCTSFYGCELWRLSDIGVQDFCTAWRKSVRKIWKLPHRTRCYMLPLLCHCLPVFDEIYVPSVNLLMSFTWLWSDQIYFLVLYKIWPQ